MHVVPIPPHEEAATPMLPGMQEWLDGQRPIKMVKVRNGMTIRNFNINYNVVYDRGSVVDVRYP